jgi:hypothetical protein
VNEQMALDLYIEGLLKGDAVVASVVADRCYATLAPQGVTFPYIVFTPLSAPDKRGVGGARFATRPLYWVDVFTDRTQDSDDLAALLTQLDALFDVGCISELLPQGLALSGHHREEMHRRALPSRSTEVYIAYGMSVRFWCRTAAPSA